jgi:hypothetical protein
MRCASSFNFARGRPHVFVGSGGPSKYNIALANIPLALQQTYR